jgi:hypothetical protein
VTATDRCGDGRIDSADPAQRLDAQSRDHLRDLDQHFEAAADDVASLSSLVSAVADGPTGRRGDDRTAIRLHHVTLPKLAARGVLEYDSRSHTVRWRDRDVDDAPAAAVGSDD